jgi:hypothetical protein
MCPTSVGVWRNQSREVSIDSSEKAYFAQDVKV